MVRREIRTCRRAEQGGKEKKRGCGRAECSGGEKKQKLGEVGIYIDKVKAVANALSLPSQQISRFLGLFSSSVARSVYQIASFPRSSLGLAINAQASTLSRQN